MEEKNEGPGKIKKVANFAKAAAKHAANGFQEVCETEYYERVSICDKCPYRKKNECIKCGCIISRKAWWLTEDCPENKWPKLK